MRCTTYNLFITLKVCLKKKKPYSKNDMCAQSHGCVRFFVTPWTVACQAPLSMGIFRQELWSRLPFSPPGE